MSLSNRNDENTKLSGNIINSEILVEVEGGTILGEKTEDVLLFKGIPYAAPPIGQNRWKEPKPVIPWEGVKKCDSYKNICFQSENIMEFYRKEFYWNGQPQKSEDCLYLNVFAPAKQMDAKLPVMVWIHGGGFTSGWSYENEFNSFCYAKKDVILVTIEYRLGIFGFMAHPDLSIESPNNVSGNYGILDQIAALKWVQTNIKNFGGDPKNITVFGQSAGAMSINVLSCSPLAKDLFNKAILQSGDGINAGNTSILLSDAEKIGEELQKELNCASISDMRLVSPESLVNLIENFKPASVPQDMFLYLLPNIDGFVIPDSVSAIINNGDNMKIPYMLGYTSNDLPGFAIQAKAQAQIESKLSKKQIYLYSFNRNLPGDDSGAFHSSELWYVFQTLDKCWRPFTEKDCALAESMSSYWANFAKNGNPNGKGMQIWNPYSYKEKEDNIMEFDI